MTYFSVLLNRKPTMGANRLRVCTSAPKRIRSLPVASARIRLVFLCISQTLRVLADWCLRWFVFLETFQSGAFVRHSAWHVTTAVFIAPFVLFCPFNGAISNSLPKRWVLVGAAAFCAVAVFTFGVLGGPWLACLGAMAVGAAVFSPTRYAVLPAVAQDTGLPLSRVNSWIEMAGAAAIVGGAVLGHHLHGNTLPQSGGWPLAVLAALGLNLLAMLLALPTNFPSDIRRPERPVEALRGLFRDGRRIAADREARLSLLGLTFFLALMTVGAGVLAQYALGLVESQSHDGRIRALFLVFLGVAAGSFLAGLQRHLYRGLGLVPLAAVGLLISLAWAAGTENLIGPCILLGLMGGVLNVPLRAFYQASVPADARGNGMAFMNLAIHLCTVALSLLVFALAEGNVLATATAQFAFLMVLTGLGAISAGALALRPLLEQIGEIVLWPIYRIRGHGPGVQAFPMSGPVLIVSNHAAWGDPLWLGKVVPRFLTPMMTSVYYDKPVVHWLMKHVTHTIRVPASRFRREAPELKDAVSALDEGRVVLVFPEGALKRKEEQWLRQFGQGVWRILKERPATPVVVCWIEGGWRSYTSYYNGPPTVNKRFDWWWRIRIAMDSPRQLDADLLGDQRATRAYLMQACLALRKYLGLPSTTGLESTVEAED
jgi:1-acyl-sn-glycerol-3-phosphate acyltransferase